MTGCEACFDSREIALPLALGREEMTCPCCVPWKHGFPGFGWNTPNGWRWMIEPSAPNQLAQWKGR